MTPQEVIALFQQPEKLLRRCLLIIAGGATRSPTNLNAPLPPPNGMAPTATFKVTDIDSTKVSGPKRVYVRIDKLSGAAKVGKLPEDEFTAFYVPMVQTEDVTSGHSHYTLSADPQTPNIMLTSRLSGCTFGIGSKTEDGTRLVTHIQPNSSVYKDVVERQRGLQNTVLNGFTNSEGMWTSRFRLGSDYTECAAIIGHRKDRSWRFYLQPSEYKDSSWVLSDVVCKD